MFANEVANFIRLLKRFKFLVVVDESHHVKRGRGGVWFDALAKRMVFAERRVVLSGTPAPNNLIDLRPQLQLLWPGIPDLEGAFDSLGDLSVDFQLVRESVRPF